VKTPSDGSSVKPNAGERSGANLFRRERHSVEHPSAAPPPLNVTGSETWRASTVANTRVLVTRRTLFLVLSHPRKPQTILA
jgi:hypothetical protein